MIDDGGGLRRQVVGRGRGWLVVAMVRLEAVVAVAVAVGIVAKTKQPVCCGNRVLLPAGCLSDVLHPVAESRSATSLSSFET